MDRKKENYLFKYTKYVIKTSIFLILKLFIQFFLRKSSLTVI